MIKNRSQITLTNKKDDPTKVTWTSKSLLWNHYNDHVLKNGEEPTSLNPKFNSNMTIDDYKLRAEKIANSEAEGSGCVKCKILGWRLQPRPEDNTRTIRCIKIKRGVKRLFRPEYAKNKPYKEAVIYVCDPDTNDYSIISYFILKPTYFFKLKEQMYSELPENIGKVYPKVESLTTPEVDNNDH